MRFSALETGFKMSESELFDKLIELGTTNEKANKAAEFWRKKRVPITRIENFTSEQLDEFTIRDNVDFGEWDFDLLANEWDSDNLLDWGVDIHHFVHLDESELIGDNKNKAAKMTITFESITDLENAMQIIEQQILPKFKGAYFSVSAGAL